VRLVDVDEVLGAGRDARDAVHRVTIEHRLPWNAFVDALRAAMLSSRAGPNDPPAAVVATAKTALAEYAELLRRLAVDSGDAVLLAEAERAEPWSNDLWAATGRERVPESTRIRDELSPSLAHLAEIWTGLILGRPRA